MNDERMMSLRREGEGESRPPSESPDAACGGAAVHLGASLSEENQK